MSQQQIKEFGDVYSCIMKGIKIIDLQDKVIMNQDEMIKNLNNRIDILEKIIERKDMIIELLEKKNGEE